MQKYAITADMGSDLPSEFFVEQNIDVVPMPLVIDGVECERGKEIVGKPFYDMLRAGSRAQTSQINAEDARGIIEKHLKDGEDVLHLSFSSGMSGSFDIAKGVVDELQAKYPDRKVRIVDTLSAGGGVALIILYAIKIREAGTEIDAAQEQLQVMATKQHQYFVMDDLQHLVRGGRLTKVAGLIGTVLQLKPVLHLTPQGSIEPYSKSIGEKKAIRDLVDFIIRDITGFEKENDFIIVTHCDTLEKAQNVGALLETKTGIPIKYLYMSPIIGAHTGAGAISVFFIGDFKSPTCG